VKLLNVWVVEGDWGSPDATFAEFGLRVESDGWTLTDTEQSIVERQWSWDNIGGLEVVRGAGRTPDGRSATALDVVVNGWPVRLLVPTEEMPVETITMLGAFAPLGHPLRGNPRVKGTMTTQRWSEAGWRFASLHLPARPAFLRGVGATRLGAALVVVLVLVATVVGASIAGVATSAEPTTTGPGHATPQGTGSNTSRDGSSSSSQASGTSSSSTAGPALAASGSGGGSGPVGLIIVRPRSGGKSSQGSTKKGTTTTSKGTSSKGTTTTSKGTTASAGGDPTATLVVTTDTGATTSTTAAPRPTTTTRPPRPTTTTRPPRPRPTTTTTEATTTTTQATTTTTQATTTTTQATTTTTSATTTTTLGLVPILGL
jgi:hypothetical protein